MMHLSDTDLTIIVELGRATKQKTMKTACARRTAMANITHEVSEVECMDCLASRGVRLEDELAALNEIRDERFMGEEFKLLTAIEYDEERLTAIRNRINLIQGGSHNG